MRRAFARYRDPVNNPGTVLLLAQPKIEKIFDFCFCQFAGVTMRDYVRRMARRAVPTLSVGRRAPRPSLSFEERMAAGFVPGDIEVSSFVLRPGVSVRRPVHWSVMLSIFGLLGPR